jgi:hypothetical protein
LEIEVSEKIYGGHTIAALKRFVAHTFDPVHGGDTIDEICKDSATSARVIVDLIAEIERAAKPVEAAQPFKWCDGCISAHACAMCGKCQVQSAPVPQDGDERARFEVDLLAYFAEKQPDRTLTLEAIKGWRGSDGDYAERPVVRGMWEGWQRRAALASNKAAAVAVTDLAADISADRHFIAGVKLGWNFRDANDEKGFQACIEGRSAQIREAKATPPAPIASASEAVPDAWMHILAKPGKRTVWASVEENDTPEDLRDWLKKPNSYRVDKPLYTHPAAAQPSRAEVLEDAASLIEPKNGPNDWTEYAKIKAECAAAIRALKDKP